MKRRLSEFLMNKAITSFAVMLVIIPAMNLNNILQKFMSKLFIANYDVNKTTTFLIAIFIIDQRSCEGESMREMYKRIRTYFSPKKYIIFGTQKKKQRRFDNFSNNFLFNALC